MKGVKEEERKRKQTVDFLHGLCYNAEKESAR